MAALHIRQLRVGPLKPLDLDIAAGECVCLSGASGSGKTRLLRAIADLDPHQGELSIDDEACASMRGSRWRRRVGYLAAESQWWAETVGEHFAANDRPPCGRLGLPPNSLARRVAELSTGERQRLALLRLLANEPQVLLLDEPTASLDAVSRSRVERLLRGYLRRHKAAALWVSHDAGQIRRIADRHLVLRAGRIGERQR